MNLLSFGFVLLLLVVATSQHPCTSDYQCEPVTTHYNYARCIDGICTCRSALGFDGEATPESRCRCDSPKTVQYQHDRPYCLSFDDCVDTASSLARTERLKQKVVAIYDSLIYPTPLQIISGEITMDDVFAPTARGRVDPLGNFETKTTLMEYFYGLAITPNTISVGNYVKDLEGVGDKVFIRIDVTFEATMGPLAGFQFNLTETGRFTFDETDRVVSANLIIHNLGKATDPPVEGRAQAIQAVCGILKVQPGMCNSDMDSEGFYTDVQDCVDFMTNIPYGSFDRAFSNSVSCRIIHTFMAIYDPVIHCKHAGKTGGGKCIDVPYADYYLQEF